MPLAFDTADLVNAPHVGIDLKKDPSTLHIPRAIISCVASTILPDAVEDEIHCKFICTFLTVIE